jgi:hypothetical protein
MNPRVKGNPERKKKSGRFFHVDLYIMMYRGIKETGSGEK